MLTGRSTRLSFDDFLSDIIQIDNGIGQGETSSMLLYLIYSYGFVSIPTGPAENGGAYVDDNFFMACGNDFNECDTILNQMLDRQEMV
jgi:hypothetical protein